MLNAINHRHEGQILCDSTCMREHVLEWPNAQTERRIAVARGWGDGDLFRGYRFSDLQDERVLGIWAAQQCKWV